jgi:hypothetical protein
MLPLSNIQSQIFKAIFRAIFEAIQGQIYKAKFTVLNIQGDIMLKKNIPGVLAFY